MSVIKTEPFEVCGKTYEKRMTYRAGSGKFEIKVPAEIGEALHSMLASGATEKECDQNFTEIMLQFASLKQKKDKVILYRIDLEGKITRGGEVVYERGHFTDDRGVKISFDYAVANRFRCGERTSYCDETGRKIWMAGESVMDWTEEREAFFAGFQGALETAILRSNEFFKKNSKQLARLIDKRAKPLLLGGPARSSYLWNGSGKPKS